MSDHVEYLEKKNIQDHLVKFDDSKQPRDQSIRETITPSQDKLNSNVSVTTNLGESHADSKADDHHHSNELQERIDRLKKNMHHVNDSLKDIQSQSDDSKL
jgi:type IV secretory pathway VirB9-like protein